MMKFKKSLLWFLNSYIWLFILILALDIVTKQLVVKYLGLGESVKLIPGFLHITYSINDKAAFSIGFPNALVNKIVYSVIAVAVTAFVIYLYLKKYKKLNGWVKACMMLILTGAIGNVIDRLFYSPSFLHSGSELCGVVDWIDFCGIWGAIFNIADSAVVIAAILMIVYFLMEEIRDNKKETKKEETK